MVEFTFENFYNDYTLNIFCDGSYNRGTSVYGVIALNKDTTINSQVVKTDDLDNINMVELKGIRCSLSMARSYMKYYKCINIFSDSKTSIDKVLKFYYNPEKNTTNQVIKQIREIYKCIDENPNSTVTIYYIPSHTIPYYTTRSYVTALKKFQKNNNTDRCENKLFGYLSRGNDLADRMCTMYRKFDYNKQKVTCPFILL